jgi:hypothetical protein
MRGLVVRVAGVWKTVADVACILEAVWKQQLRKP